MNFYFCETCGKRLTDAEIARGEGRDKKLKGVFCASCAVGVMTVEMDAIQDHELAAAPVKHNRSRSDATPQKGSARSLKPARTEAKAPRVPLADSSSASSRSMKPTNNLVLPIGIVSGLVIAVALIFTVSGRSAPTPPTASSLAKPVEKPPAPIAPVDASATRPASLPETPVPVVTETKAAPSTGRAEDPEERATKAFDLMAKACDKLPAADKDGRVALANAFLKDYGETIASARARVLIRQWTEPPPAPAPAAQLAPPAPAATPTAVASEPTNKDGTVLFEESFDGPTCDGLAFADLVDGPAGSHGKVARGSRSDTFSKIGIADWASHGRKVQYTVSEKTHFRFRYYNTNCRDIQFVIILDPKVYEHALDTTTNKWINVDLQLKDLLDGEKKPLQPGTVVRFIQIGAGSGEGKPKEIFMDDLVVIEVKP